MSLTDRRAQILSVPTQTAEGELRPLLFSVDLLALEDETILTMRGELDMWTQRDFVVALDSVDDGVERLVLDLTDLTFIDAGSIGIIYKRRRLLESRGGTLVLRSPSAQLRRVLEITGMIPSTTREQIRHRVVLPPLPRAFERESMESHPS